MKLKNSLDTDRNDDVKFECGSRVTYVGQKGVPYSTRQYCNRWSCETCRPENIKKYKNKITKVLVTGRDIDESEDPIINKEFKAWLKKTSGMNVFLSYIPVATKSSERSFKQRAIRGEYIRIPTTGHIVYIAMRQVIKEYRKMYFEKYNFKFKTMNRKNFCKNYLQVILENEKKSSGNISNSKNFYPPYMKKQQSESNLYASLRGDKKDEWNKLKTDRERAEYLEDHRGKRNIYKKGEEFIKKHINDPPPEPDKIVAVKDKDKNIPLMMRIKCRNQQLAQAQIYNKGRMI